MERKWGLYPTLPKTGCIRRYILIHLHAIPCYVDFKKCLSSSFIYMQLTLTRGRLYISNLPQNKKGHFK